MKSRQQELDSIVKHYYAIPILLDFIKQAAYEGISGAQETLYKWDEARKDLADYSNTISNYEGANDE